MTATKENRREPETEALPVTTEQIWHEIEKGSFAVLSYVTPTGAPRVSGVMYKVVDRRLYVVVAPDSWKAKHIARDGRVAISTLVWDRVR